MSAQICAYPNTIYYHSRIMNAVNTVDYSVPFREYCLFNENNIQFVTDLLKLLNKQMSCAKYSYKILLPSLKNGLQDIKANLR